jgi:hypothetical protein
VVVLTTIIPLIVRFFRPLYSPLPEEGASNIDATRNNPNPEVVLSETSDHLDIHITIGSWVIEALAYIAVGATTTPASQLVGQCQFVPFNHRF